MKNCGKSRLDLADTLVTPQCLYAGYSVKKQRGFTLIELLVIVLIIGILAAIAVPQYRVAVLKSKASSAFTLARAVAQAQQAYKLANGGYTRNLEDLDLSFSCTYKKEDGGDRYYECPNYLIWRSLPSGGQIYFPLDNSYKYNGNDKIIFWVNYEKGGMGADNYCYPSDPLGCRVLSSLCDKRTDAFGGMEFYDCSQ